MKWDKVPSDLRDKLLVAYDQGRDISRMASSLGMNPETLKRRLREHRQTLNIFTEPIEEDIEQQLKRTQYLLAPSFHNQPLKAPLTDIQFIDPDTDQGRWLDTLYELQSEHPRVNVMHLCDIHFPYHNPAALEVAYQLVEYVQPEICVVGSDAADFALISKFDPDPDLDCGQDVLDEFCLYWFDHIDQIMSKSPRTVLVYVLGNHEKRIFDFINRQAPQVRNSVLSRFNEIICYGGRVLWIGETDTVRIGPLLVTHGNRAGMNPAKGLFDDAGGQVSVMAGHVHRLSEHTQLGEDFPVRTITSGCLCAFPHYAARKRVTRKMQLGTAIAEVDLNGREVRFENLVFQEERDRIWVHLERKRFEAKVERKPGLLTYEEYLALK